MSEAQEGAAGDGDQHDDDIHMPPNSYWPLVASVGTVGCLLGIVYFHSMPLVMVGGVVILVVGAGGWVRDALKEYHELH
jgi:hypothetical protein